MTAVLLLAAVACVCFLAINVASALDERLSSRARKISAWCAAISLAGLCITALMFADHLSGAG